ncbi:hypothetical protein T10_6981 [Trichinella papuae]|uniref:Uncharacterized protein n=1 Tax=Trichinella papuae TaxID=268474 RepID=A0A0V1MHC2_9BILA|nr:hypothetical protein T10_6981 [Trichinella papuae]
MVPSTGHAALTSHLLWAAEGVLENLNCVRVICCSDRNSFDGASRLSYRTGQEKGKLRRDVQITSVVNACGELGQEEGWGEEVQHFSRKRRES